jgi:16S rRNA (uracil1498-N3)-methyltransferase
VHWLYDPALTPNSSQLPASEAVHAKSLRLRIGELVTITNGQGLIAVSEMTSDGGYLIQSIETRALPTPRFHLVQALAKGDRDELAMQSCVELGLSSVTPWSAERSIVRWDGKEAKNQIRWQQIAIEAMKQSQQAFRCEVNPLSSTKQLVATGAGLVLDPRAERSIADVLPLGDDVTLVVGPEGGISDAEFELLETKGFQRVRLGPSVLRTSSAGPAAISALQFASGLWS